MIYNLQKPKSLRLRQQDRNRIRAKLSLSQIPYDTPRNDLRDNPQTLDIDVRKAYDAHIISKIVEYQELNLQDNVLWRAFCKDFQD